MLKIKDYSESEEFIDSNQNPLLSIQAFISKTNLLLKTNSLLKCKNKKELPKLCDKYKIKILFSLDLNEFITADDLDPSIKNIIVFDDCVTIKI